MSTTDLLLLIGVGIGFLIFTERKSITDAVQAAANETGAATGAAAVQQLQNDPNLTQNTRKVTAGVFEGIGDSVAAAFDQNGNWVGTSSGSN